MKVSKVDLDRKGDGLHSIFSDQRFANSPLFGEFAVTSAKKRSLIDNSSEQNIVIGCLQKWGIFAGFEFSLLDDICSRASRITKNAGDIIFNHSNKSDTLYILISGSCSAYYIDEDGKEYETSQVKSKKGDAIGSIIDIIAWILRSSIPRQLTIKCLEPCEVLAVPSPREADGQYSSQAHLACFSRILQLLLIRVNRTTVATAFFYMGLAEHIIPAFKPLPIPTELQRLVEVTDTAALNDQLQKMGSGEDGKDGKQQEARNRLRSMLVSTVSALFTPDLSQLSDGKPSPPRSPSSTENLPKELNTSQDVEDSTPPLLGPPVRRSHSLDGNADLNVLSRALQFQADVYRADTTSTLPASVKGALGRPKEPMLEVVKMEAGQSVLDLDAIPGLYVVLSGEVSLEYVGDIPHPRDLNPESTEEKRELPEHSSLFSIWERSDRRQIVLRTGAVVGHIALIAGSSEEWYGRKGSTAHPMLRVVALCKTVLIKVPRVFHEKMMKARPESMMALSERIIAGFSPIIRVFDFGSKWVKKDGGEDLVTAGTSAAGSIFVLLTGKLRIVHPTSSSDGQCSGDSDDEVEPEDVGHGNSTGTVLGRGALIGGSEALSGHKFSYTVRTMRSCTLACIPRSLLAFVIQKYPSVLRHLIRNATMSVGLNPMVGPGLQKPMCKTIAVLAVTLSVPLDLFCSLLSTAMGHGNVNVKVLTSSLASGVFGRALDSMGADELQLNVSPWMQNMEADHDVVIFQCDWQQDSTWNRLCGAHADELLLVANGSDRPQVGPAEYQLGLIAQHLPKTLVLLHVDPTPHYHPKDTRHWIELRSGVKRHIHVRLHSSDLQYDAHHYRSDFSRLARILCNTAIGVVLGGGGARGLSHIGVLQALEEAEIPIDFVGGTSMGAFVGALYASRQNVDEVQVIVEQWASGMGSLWSYVRDLTLPITSYFNGYTFTSAIRRCFGTQKIEDLWLGYFCVTTDLSSHKELVHVNGTAWRYIRASMSLANFLPPVCDVDRSTTPHTCHYLVDGGYVNNLPADVMRKNFGADIVISADVSGDWALKAKHIYSSKGLSGLYVFMSIINPFGKSQNVPSMAQISQQLAYVSAKQQIKHARRLSDLYLKPPLDSYSIFDIPKLLEIKAVGYETANQEIRHWRKQLQHITDSGSGHSKITPSDKADMSNSNGVVNWSTSGKNYSWVQGRTEST
eukprot:CAMPEP_0182418908 /NCGR_PEP_ID=MMETSP1167-20130531/3287_1 /TAXON_ID=2988 /ORGANISM="Mallomonas Sp, Strain CCMP3275" /LENGTH=1191 /DNA_ID=CAMNT_0024593387 /DNA_START=314 /DNA_END=3889 /DNA_ORIENTATION=-